MPRTSNDSKQNSLDELEQKVYDPKKAGFLRSIGLHINYIPFEVTSCLKKLSPF